MRIDVLTTVPGIVDTVLGESIIGRARQRGIVEIRAVNIRDFTEDRHKTTDDAPYGGGPGMVMKVEPVWKALEALKQLRPGCTPRVLLMTPQGRRFDQALAEELAVEDWLVVICGRYEGVDERIREHLASDEVSVGDYVLTGGELPALVVIDAVVRLVPGVLGDEASAEMESFSSGLLEYPQYTRPADFMGWKVPEELLSGNHARIARWRREAALRRTYQRRPDLLEDADLTEDDRRFLDSIREAASEED